MIGHYLASALTRFRKSPFTTAANVLTLALGLACFIAAYGIATYWRSGDMHHPEGDRLVVIGQAIAFGGSPAGGGLNPVSSTTLARYLRADLPELEPAARVYGVLDVAVAAGGEKALLDAIYVDPAFLDLFELRFLEGDARSALARPDSVVLFEDAARRMFGDRPALGQPVRLDGARDATVTGVAAPMRQPSFLGPTRDFAAPAQMLAPFGSSPQTAALDEQDNWLLISAFTFARRPADMTLAELNGRLSDLVTRRMPQDQKDAATVTLTAFPASEITTRRLNGALLNRSGIGLSAVGVLLGLAILTLIVACLNYANLATAQASARGKEIGVRRVMGAGLAHVAAQAWLEAVLLSLAATVIALAVLVAAAPAIDSMSGVEILYFLRGGVAPWAAIGGLALLAALAAGAYPALALARLQPTAALGRAKSRFGVRGVAQTLVAVQFASASFLLVLVAVTQLQRAELERTALGALEEPVVALGDLRGPGLDFATLESRLASVPGVRSVTITSANPWQEGGNMIRLSRTPDGPHEPAGFMKSIGYDFFRTLSLDVLAGRVFERERGATPLTLMTAEPTQTIDIVIDEAKSRALGFASPDAAIGEVVYFPESLMGPAGRPAQPARIIGVTETETTRLEYAPASGQVYVFSPQDEFARHIPMIRIAAENVPLTAAGIAAVWDELAPDFPSDIRYFDEMFEGRYQTFARVGQLFLLLAGVAFVIASVGLVGVAVHATGRRRHEIGVRKTLGATTLRVLRLLIVDFSKPVVIGNLVAWPVAWMAAEIYLRAFSHRTSLTPVPFILSLIITLLIAWASVGGQAWKAARVKPALVLKAE